MWKVLSKLEILRDMGWFGMELPYFVPQMGLFDRTITHSYYYILEQEMQDFCTFHLVLHLLQRSYGIADFHLIQDFYIMEMQKRRWPHR